MQRKVTINFDSVQSLEYHIKIMTGALKKLLPKPAPTPPAVKQTSTEVTFLVDLSSEDSILKTLNTLKSKLGDIRSLDGRQTKNSRNASVYESCKAIFSTDVSVVYTDKFLDRTRSFYVYAHVDTSHLVSIARGGIHKFASDLGLSHMPFYIGKGKGFRFEDLSRNGSHSKYKDMACAIGGSVEAVKLKDGLTESEALALESKLIDIFGLKVQGGMLTNIDEGHNSDARRKLYLDSLISLRPLNQKLFSHLLPKVRETKRIVVRRRVALESDGEKYSGRQFDSAHLHHPTP